MNVLNAVTRLEEDATGDNAVQSLNDKVIVCIENEVNLRNKVDECIHRLKVLEADLLDVKNVLYELLQKDKKVKRSSGYEKKNSNSTETNRGQLTDDVAKWIKIANTKRNKEDVDRFDTDEI